MLLLLGSAEPPPPPEELEVAGASLVVTEKLALTPPIVRVSEPAVE